MMMSLLSSGWRSTSIAALVSGGGTGMRACQLGFESEQADRQQREQGEEKKRKCVACVVD